MAFTNYFVLNYLDINLNKIMRRNYNVSDELDEQDGCYRGY